MWDDSRTFKVAFCELYGCRASGVLKGKKLLKKQGNFKPE